LGSDWVEEADKELTDETQRWLNSAFLVDGQGEVLAQYAKIRIVPFGEYIPFQQTLPFMCAFRSITRDSYRAGTVPSPLFDLCGMRGAFNICIEDIHSDLARASVRAGAQVLFNLTNDGWFSGTSGPRMHLLIAHFRAIETGSTLVRVTNTGWSAVVNPLGEIGLVVPPDQEGVGWTVLPKTGKVHAPLYLRLGDFGVACGLFLLALVAWSCDVLLRGGRFRARSTGC
jgi:apolipoprotein N-acyltransferase